MRTRAAAVAAAVAVLVGALPATASAQPSAPAVVGIAVRPAVATAGVVSGPAQEILADANAARAAAGLPALVIDASLTDVAQNWNNAMAATATLAHNPYTGVQIPAGWQSWGENVGWTKPADAQRLHDAWMASPGHRANLLNPAFTHIGIGWTVDAGGRSWATQVFAQYPASVSLPRFADVPFGARFYGDIEWAVTRGVATGYSGGLFRPVTAVTREAMAAFLYRAVTGRATSACSSGDRTFSDVPSSHPFCSAIEWLAGQGITTGYPDGTFRPGQAVSREAIAAFLYRTMNDGADPTCEPGARRFTDMPASEPFCGVVEWLGRTGITTGWPDGSFRPSASVERQAMTAFLHRAFG